MRVITSTPPAAGPCVKRSFATAVSQAIERCGSRETGGSTCSTSVSPMAAFSACIPILPSLTTPSARASSCTMIFTDRRVHSDRHLELAGLSRQPGGERYVAGDGGSVAYAAALPAALLLNLVHEEDRAVLRNAMIASCRSTCRCLKVRFACNTRRRAGAGCWFRDRWSPSVCSSRPNG